MNEKATAKRKLPLLRIIGLLALLTAGGLGLYRFAPHSTASVPVVPAARWGEAKTIAAAQRGNPWIKVLDGREVLTDFAGTPALQAAFADNRSRPLSAVALDFDEDGMPDLVAGYATDAGGAASWLRGNVDAVYPNTAEAKARKADGTFTGTPFLGPAQLFALSVAPDFLIAGDFDADGHLDLVTASRADNALWFLAGNGRVGFLAAQRRALPGRVTALMADDFNRRDGLNDMLVGVQTKTGGQLLVFEHPYGAMKATPEIFDFAAPVTSLATAPLDGSAGYDLAITAGRELAVLSGRDRMLTRDASGQSADAPRLTRQVCAFGIEAVAVGNFVREPVSRLEIALLARDGTVRLLANGGAADAKSNSPSLWREQTTVELPHGAASAARPVMLTTRVSARSIDTLTIGLGRQIHLLTSDITPARRGKQPDYAAQRFGLEATLDVAGATAAMVPMRLNLDALSDLVVLRDNAVAPAIVPTAPTASFTVNNASDEGDCNLSDGICAIGPFIGGVCTGSCSLRAAFDQTSFIPGMSTIMFATAGPYGGSSFAGGYNSSNPLTIDGTSVGRAEVANRSISLGNDNDVVRGLALNAPNPNVGVTHLQFVGTSNSIVEDVRIGTNPAGTGLVAAGSGKGIEMFTDTGNNRIGGSVPAARNLISGAGFGVSIDANPQTAVNLGNTIQGNFIGTDITGTLDFGNVGDGIFLSDGSFTVGGTASGTANLLSGNGRAGVFISTNNGTPGDYLIQGNLIGIASNGTAALGNSDYGVVSSTSASDAATTVGGTTAGARNIISGNGLGGVSVGTANNNPNAPTQRVIGNYIGTNAAGNQALGNNGWGVLTGSFAQPKEISNNVISGNAQGGIQIGGTSGDFRGDLILNNFIGTNATGNQRLGNNGPGVEMRIQTGPNGVSRVSGNTIAANTGHGVYIFQGSGARYESNFIGTNANLLSTLGNGGDGINIFVGSNNIIGGPELGNTIAFNSEHGIYIFGSGADNNRVLDNRIFNNGNDGVSLVASIGNGIRRNQIFGNGGLGIDLDNDGVTPNDEGDADNGANQRQNFPVLTAATSGSPGAFVNATLNSTANTTFRIEFFSSPSCDTSGNGEGEVLLGVTNATTDGNGNATINRANLLAVTVGQVVTATATNLTTNDTSEFSACRVVTPFVSPSITGRLTDSNNQPLAGVAVALSGAASGTTLTDNNGNYAFTTLQPGGNYTVIPNSPAYVLTPARADFNNLVASQTQNFTAPASAVPSSLPSLTDDFPPRPNPDPTLWRLGVLTQPPGAFDPAVTVSQQTGQLVITPVANAFGLHYNGYVSVNSLDLTNGQASVELVQAGTGGAEALFSIGNDFQNFARFLVQSPLPDQSFTVAPVLAGEPQTPFETTMTMLMFQLVQNGQVFLNVALPYDPVAHRFLRFRHVTRDANQNPINALAFETSPDAGVWTERARGDLGERNVQAITVELAGGTAGAAGNPGPVIFDNLATQVVNCRFDTAGYTANEGAGSLTVTVRRTGLLNLASTVDYFTLDGTASQRSRYVAAAGALSFAPGENQKPLVLLLNDNALVDGTQTFEIFLSNPNGAGVNGPGRTIVTINDNDTPPINTNPLENVPFFVTEQYYDFLSRVPDQGGLDFWTGQITNVCGADQACISRRRWQVSLAFFVELEFQQTGAYVYRLYRAAYGNTQPFPNPSGNADAHPYCVQFGCPFRAEHIPSYQRFVLDRARVVGGAQLAATQLALAQAFVNRAEFRQRYPATLTGPQFVDAVLANIQAVSNVNLASQRDALIVLHNTGGRGAVLYRLADDNIQTNPVNNRAFIDAEYNRGFVLTQYFGYLRRDPDQPGLNFWLSTVNRFPVRDLPGQNAMVCAFVTSQEYQERFSLINPRSNGECPPAP